METLPPQRRFGGLPQGNASQRPSVEIYRPAPTAR